MDVDTGDRQSGCRGQMEPIAVWVRKDGDWAVVHRCRKCGAMRTNCIAGDDNELALISLAIRPLAQPAFPLDRLLPQGSGDSQRNAAPTRREQEQTKKGPGHA